MKLMICLVCLFLLSACNGVSRYSSDRTIYDSSGTQRGSIDGLGNMYVDGKNIGRVDSLGRINKPYGYKLNTPPARIDSAGRIQGGAGIPKGLTLQDSKPPKYANRPLFDVVNGRLRGFINGQGLLTVDGRNIGLIDSEGNIKDKNNLFVSKGRMDSMGAVWGNIQLFGLTFIRRPPPPRPKVVMQRPFLLPMPQPRIIQIPGKPPIFIPR